MKKGYLLVTIDQGTELALAFTYCQDIMLEGVGRNALQISTCKRMKCCAFKGRVLKTNRKLPIVYYSTAVYTVQRSNNFISAFTISETYFVHINALKLPISNCRHQVRPVFSTIRAALTIQ